MKRSLILFYLISLVFIGSSAALVFLALENLEIPTELLALALACFSSLGTLLVPLQSLKK